MYIVKFDIERAANNNDNVKIVLTIESLLDIKLTWDPKVKDPKDMKIMKVPPIHNTLLTLTISYFNQYYDNSIMCKETMRFFVDCISKERDVKFSLYDHWGSIIKLHVNAGYFEIELHGMKNTYPLSMIKDELTREFLKVVDILPNHTGISKLPCLIRNSENRFQLYTDLDGSHLYINTRAINLIRDKKECNSESDPSVPRIIYEIINNKTMMHYYQHKEYVGLFDYELFLELIHDARLKYHIKKECRKLGNSDTNLGKGPQVLCSIINLNGEELLVVDKNRIVLRSDTQGICTAIGILDDQDNISRLDNKAIAFCKKKDIKINN
jgi:hypothetical protein